MSEKKQTAVNESAKQKAVEMVEKYEKEIGLSDLNVLPSMNLSLDVGPSSPSGSDRFKKGDFICMTGKDKRFEYWKCIVADSDSAVFGKVLYHRVAAPGKCSVSWADIFITHSACSLIGHRVDSLPDIG